MTARTATLALVIAAITAPAAAQVHRWVDERGVVQYGDRPPAGASRLRVRAESGTAPGAAPVVPAAGEASRAARMVRVVPTQPVSPATGPAPGTPVSEEQARLANLRARRANSAGS